MSVHHEELIDCVNGPASHVDWRVLIVDDREKLRRELSRALKDHGFTVFKAQSGRRAISIARQKRIDVAIVDLDMPNLDGIDTIEQMGQFDRRIRFIVLSARDNTQYRQRAADKGLIIERWLDKDENYLMACAFSVFDAIGTEVDSGLAKSIGDLARVAQLTQEQAIMVQRWLQRYSVVLPSGLRIVEKPDLADREVRRAPRDLHSILRDMALSVEECYRGFDDAVYRQLAWDEVRRMAEEELWPATDKQSPNEWRRQLVVQLKSCVLRIEAPVLTLKHLEAGALSIQRLRSQVVTEEDVAQCDNAWELSGIDAVPSFAEVLKEWHVFYQVTEESDDEPPPDLT